ncbi:MAG TPA: hypothetical protein VHF89_15995 [Solirubrobacteraceae bacterium]|nr:hypothetical protein [Solirubrobacteraceae bacterium]
MFHRAWRLAALCAVVAGLLAAAAPASATTAPIAPDALTPPAPTAAPSELRRAIDRALASGARPQKLRRATPAWYDREAKRRVQRDRDGVTTAPVDAPLPGEIGIRPGSWMVSPYWCTMNFLFRKSGTLAIGTAGHCLEGKEPVVLLTLAPGGSNPVLVQLGRVLLKRDAGIGQDYGLVEIPPHLHSWAFPTMGVVGGPCGVYGGGDPQPVAHYGHGVGVGTGGTPRAGMGFELAQDPRIVRGVDWDWDADSIVWAGLINGGDSGSGVRIGQLPAVSNLTHGIGITGLEPSALAWGTRVTTITGSGWTLVNSPLCPP